MLRCIPERGNTFLLIGNQENLLQKWSYIYTLYSMFIQLTKEQKDMFGEDIYTAHR